MTKINIPATIDDAVSTLNGLGRLLTAKEWERAAIVYAFTRDGQGERTDLGTSSDSTGSLTITAFAAKGITGLKSDATVRIYRKAWQGAIDAGKAEPVEPGDVLDVLPDMAWPPTEPRTGHHPERALTHLRNSQPERKAEVLRLLLAEPVVTAMAIEDAPTRENVRRALDERYANAATIHEVHPVLDQEPLELLAKFRALHKTMDRIVELVTSGRAIVNEAEREALLNEVAWLRAALDHTESGINAGSLDDALRAFQEQWS